MDKAGKQQIWGSLGLLTATLLWGFSFVVVKDSTESIPVLYLLALRYLIASVGMAVFLLCRRSLPAGIPLPVIKQGIGSPVVCQPVFSDIGMQVYDSRQKCIHHNRIRDSCTIFILVDRKKAPGQKMCCRCFHSNFGHWPFIHTRGSDGSNRRLSDRHMWRRSCFAYYICR